MQDNENLEVENLDEGTSQDDNPGKDPKELIERYKNQVKGSKAEALKLRQQNINFAAVAVEKDPQYIKVLMEQDSKFANEVAKKFEGYESAEQLMKDFLGDSATGHKTLEERITERILAEMSQKTTLSEVDQKFSHLGDERKEIAKKKFEEFRAGRKLTPDQATEIADAVTLLLQKDTLIESAKQSKINSLGNLNLSGVSTVHATNTNSGAGLAQILGLGNLYTNSK